MSEELKRLLAKHAIVLVSDKDTWRFHEADLRLIEEHVTKLSKALGVSIALHNFHFVFNDKDTKPHE